MLRNMLLAAAAALGTVSFAPAEPATWSAPVLGYHFDGESKSIRVISGVPGAASMDESVPSPVKLERAFPTPARRFAVIQMREAGAAVLDWTAGASVIREVPGASQEISSVAFSTRGDRAIVASKNTGTMQVWRGLPDRPSIEHEFALDSDIVAISDDGTVAAVQGEGVFRIDVGESRLLASGVFSAIAFRPGSSELAVSGKYTDSVVVLRAESGDLVTLASAEDGIAEPVGIQFSADGKKLVVANSRDRSYTVIDMQTKRALTQPCDCSPDTVSGVGGSSFRIASPGRSPDNDAHVFVDAGSSDPRIFLIPVTGGAR
jgi:WD40 repeat protein